MFNKDTQKETLAKSYASSNPNYVVIDNLFDEDFIKECEQEFLKISREDFIKYSNPYFEFNKYTLNQREKMPTKLLQLFQFIHSQEFIDFVSSVTAFDHLYVDEKRWGGGLHLTDKGGYLSVHKDFNVLPTSYKEENQMLRCVNLIGYLNSSWKPEDGGELEFWDAEGKGILEKVETAFNRWVLFDTRENYHGHPYPYKGNSPRISIASYYYTKTKIDKNIWSSTQYLKLPWMDDSAEYSEEREKRSNPDIRYKGMI
jgi:Rps23 Pro-64 3,4-dihydroxylase Tpa1-like proline 4-hydroxylase